MNKENTKALRIGSKGVKVLRKIKARLTLEFDEDMTYRDALNFLMARSVLDDETIGTFVQSVNAIQGAEGSGPEIESAGSALSELVGLLLAPKNERENEVESFKNELRESSISTEGKEGALSSVLEKIAEAPNGALTHPWFGKRKKGEKA